MCDAAGGVGALRPRVLLWPALSVGLAVVGCSVGDAPRPNVVLVSVDTLRADALGAYGGVYETPVFDRISREGVTASTAVAPAPETAPSHASLLTGKTVRRHGVLKNGVALREEHLTLAEAFSAAGYHTAAFVSSFVLDPRFGWSQGFVDYDARFPEDGATLPKEQQYPGAFWEGQEFGGFDRRATVTTDAVIDWLTRAPQPFFLFVHYFDPHYPHQIENRAARRVLEKKPDLRGRSVPGFDARALRGFIWGYHIEVLYTDMELGRLLAALPNRAGGGDGTLVVVTADHGEGLGQHHHLEHQAHVYEELIRVPMLFHWPSHLPSGVRFETPVGLVDLAPTVAELVDVAFDGGGEGRSFASALRSAQEPEERPLLGRRRTYDAPTLGEAGDKSFVRSARWKYIRASEAPDELYDLVADPGERNDVHAHHPEIVRELGAILDAHLRETPDPPRPAPLSTESRRGLEALGYVE